MSRTARRAVTSPRCRGGKALVGRGWLTGELWRAGEASLFPQSGTPACPWDSIVPRVTRGVSPAQPRASRSTDPGRAPTPLRPRTHHGADLHSEF